MKKTMILSALALCAFPAMAQTQSASIFYTQLNPRDFNFEGSLYTTDKSRTFALRYGHDIVTFSSLGNARLGFEGTWMPRTSGEDIKMDGTPVGGGTTTIKYRQEYMGLGLSMGWTKVVDFGGALELRHEANVLRLEEPGATGEIGNDFTRLWISLRFGYSFGSASVKPFVSAEYNLPLAKKESGAGITELSLAQNLNPKSQISLIAGVRF